MQGPEECFDPQILDFFFQDEAKINSRDVEQTVDRCPFLPPPPPTPLPVPAPPPTPVVKKKKKKKKNKKKLPKKGKGKKGKKK